MVSGVKKSQLDRQSHNLKRKMAINQEYINETIAQITTVTAKAVVRQYWQKEEREMNVPCAEVMKQA